MSHLEPPPLWRRSLPHFWGPQLLCTPWLGPERGSTSQSRCCPSPSSPPFRRESWHLREEDKKMEVSKWLIPTESVCRRGRTCLVCDVDRRAGCGTVSSARYSVDGDDVISTGLQIIDCCSRLRSRNCELFRITVAPWTDPNIKPNSQTMWCMKLYILQYFL